MNFSEYSWIWSMLFLSFMHQKYNLSQEVKNGMNIHVYLSYVCIIWCTSKLQELVVLLHEPIRFKVVIFSWLWIFRVVFLKLDLGLSFTASRRFIHAVSWNGALKSWQLHNPRATLFSLYGDSKELCLCVETRHCQTGRAKWTRFELGSDMLSTVGVEPLSGEVWITEQLGNVSSADRRWQVPFDIGNVNV